MKWLNKFIGLQNFFMLCTQASVSLPGSPYNDRRRSSQPYGRDKLMVTYSNLYTYFTHSQ